MTHPSSRVKARGRMRAVGVRPGPEPGSARPRPARGASAAGLCEPGCGFDRGRLLAPPFGEAKGGKKQFAFSSTDSINKGNKPSHPQPKPSSAPRSSKPPTSSSACSPQAPQVPPILSPQSEPTTHLSRCSGGLSVREPAPVRHPVLNPPSSRARPGTG